MFTLARPRGVMLTTGLSIICSTVLNAGQPALAMELIGGVEHSESLPQATDEIRALVRRRPAPPVQETALLTPPLVPLQATVQTTPPPPPRQTAPAAPLLRAATPSLAQPAIEWFMIPAWIAGQWNKRGDLTTSVTDLQMGTSSAPNEWVDDNMTVTWGHQIDRAGNYWHANFTPNERDGHSGPELVRFVAIAQKCEAASPQHLVMRTHYIVTETYGNTNEVEDKFQQETLAEFLPTTPFEFTGRSSNKMFHMDGRAYRVGTLQSTYTKVGNFAATPFMMGFDMRKSLAEYLHSQGMDQLIPDGER